MEQIKQFIQEIKERDDESKKNFKQSGVDINTALSKIQLIDQNSYNVNKSKTKFISVGLNCAQNFCPAVKVYAAYKQESVFTQEEWMQFIEHREKIRGYFQITEVVWEPIKIGTKTLTFENIEQKKILKIVDVENEEVYLGRETLLEIWKLEKLINYRLNQCLDKDFGNFYDAIVNAVSDLPGDVKTNVSNILDKFLSKTDVVCCMLEVLIFYPEKIIFDVELEKRVAHHKRSKD